MRRFFTVLAFFAFLFVPASWAQGLVQLGLAGEIIEEGGARVEIEVAYSYPDGKIGAVELGLLLASHTSAADVASLLASRLKRAGAHFELPSETSSQRTNANLFIEDVLRIHVRVGSGLSCSVTLCEDAPAALRILPPVEQKGGANLLVVASTLQAHDLVRGKLVFDLDLKERMLASDVADALLAVSIGKGWIGEQANHDVWRPGALSSGSRVTGCSISMRGANADWRIEVELPARRQDR